MIQVKLQLIGDCRRALVDAQERSRKSGEGSEKMSDIASKARRLSEKQDLDAAEIEMMAGEAQMLANKANKLAVEGLAEQVKASSQIHKIMVKIFYTCFSVRATRAFKPRQDHVSPMGNFLKSKNNTFE